MPSQIQVFTLQSAAMEKENGMPPTELDQTGFDRSPAAFAELYRQYLNLVYRYLYLKVGNTAEAEDLTSQVFLAALEGLPRYRHQGHFAAWLFSLARRKAADYYRGAPLTELDHGEREPAAPEADLLGRVIQQEELQALSRLISALSEDERELLRLRFAARLSFEEMAAVLERKTSAVKMALYRLLERLETQLEASHE